MSESDQKDIELEVVSRELDALRQRLDQAPEWFRNARATIRIAALSKEVERLTRQASNTDSTPKQTELIAEARRVLDELHRELGPQ